MDINYENIKMLTLDSTSTAHNLYCISTRISKKTPTMHKENKSNYLKSLNIESTCY
jgi:hypothetical protein